jgi:hypothetical protein
MESVSVFARACISSFEPNSLTFVTLTYWHKYLHIAIMLYFSKSDNKPGHTI